jgi:glycerol-3-phosphate acyltransferase PlsX
MPGRKTLALDAMGGDFGPEVVIPGAAIALRQHEQLTVILFGDEERIRPLMAAHPSVSDRMRVVHTALKIGMEDKPSHALRRGKGSSMWMALEAVKSGEAQAAVSAGNTGGLMAVSRLLLRSMEGIERPALAAQWPTVKRSSIVLDVGANIGATAQQLADFSVMGAAMARSRFGIDRPTVGLLNVGVEEIKGNEEVKEAHAWLKQAGGQLPFHYHGYVEGHEIGQGIVDVVVVEGFAGNIALKTAEGTARQIGTYLKDAMRRSIASRLGAVLSRGAFEVLKNKMDPRKVNGASFLGLNGIAIKSHGSTDALGFASAINLGYDMADGDMIGRLSNDIGIVAGKLDMPAAQPGRG